MRGQKFIRPVPVYDQAGRLLRFVEGDLREAQRLAAEAWRTGEIRIRRIGGMPGALVGGRVQVRPAHF